MSPFERQDVRGGAVQTTLTADLSATATAFNIADAAGWPDGLVGNFFVVIARGKSNEEQVRCSARADTSITVVAGGRGASDTAAAFHAAGESVEHVASAVLLREANEHYSDTQADPHPKMLNNARHDVTARHAFGAALPTPGAATVSAVGHTATSGSSPNPAREDHRHGREGFGTPVTSAPGDTNADGTATTPARSDHRHGREAPLPAGVMTMYGGTTAPSGWLLCDGAAVSRSTYSALFAVFGTTHGPGDGSTTFNLPDLRGRAPIGVGTGTGLTARALGQKVGHELMQTHAHGQHVTAGVTGGTGVRLDYDADFSGANAYPQGVDTMITGGGNAENMQPSLALNFIVKT